MPHVKSGKLKALAVAMPKRLDAYPELPTFLESGLDVQIPVWVALGTPAGTPRPVIDKLNQALLSSLRDPEVSKRLAAVGFTTSQVSPDEASAFAKKQLADWAAFLKPRNIRLD
jgi:tripartite-type tricarboxylate transporter receptor subunit TctC